MTQSRLNNLMLLHIHRERLDKLCLKLCISEFVQMNIDFRAFCRIYLDCTVADPEGDPGVHRNPPFGLHLALRSTDDRLNGTPLSGYKTKKTAAMAHLRMLWKKIKFVPKQIDWTGRAVLKTIEMGVVLPHSGRGF